MDNFAALTQNGPWHNSQSSPARFRAARRVIMRPVKKTGPLGSNIFMAKRVFKWDVFRIHLSELNQIFRNHYLDVVRNTLLRGTKSQKSGVLRQSFLDLLCQVLWSCSRSQIAKARVATILVVRSTLLPVTRWRQIGSRGGSPVCMPDPPLSQYISGSCEPND